MSCACFVGLLSLLSLFPQTLASSDPLWNANFEVLAALTTQIARKGIPLFVFDLGLPGTSSMTFGSSA